MPNEAQTIESFFQTIFHVRAFSDFTDLEAPLHHAIKDTITPFQIIDLAEGKAQNRPPIDVSEGYANRADFVILTLGECYGGIPSNSPKGMKS